MFISGQRGPFSTATSTLPPARMETTGRSLVLMRHDADAMQAGIKILQSTAGLTALRTSDVRSATGISPPGASEALILDQIGVAVINGDPDQIGRLSIQSTRSDSILAIEPERVVYAAMLASIATAPGQPSLSGEFIGHRLAIRRGHHARLLAWLSRRLRSRRRTLLRARHSTAAAGRGPGRGGGGV